MKYNKSNEALQKLQQFWKTEICGNICYIWHHLTTLPLYWGSSTSKCLGIDEAVALQCESL